MDGPVNSCILVLLVKPTICHCHAGKAIFCHLNSQTTTQTPLEHTLLSVCGHLVWIKKLTAFLRFGNLIP